MKIYSNLFDEINLEEHQVHMVNFESSEKQKKFRELIEQFKVNKKSDFPYLIIEDREKNLTVKTMNLLIINGGELNYLQSKEYIKLLQSMILKEFETNPNLIEKYKQLNNTLHKIIEELSYSFEGFSIDFEFTELIMDNFWKMMNLQIENEETNNMTIFDFRKLQIESWKKIINPDLPSLIIYNFPENDTSINEAIDLFQLLKNSYITSFCISNSIHFIANSKHNNVNLISDNGEIYDIKHLSKELINLELDKMKDITEELIISLAFYDFINYTEILNTEWANFVNSNKY